MVLFRKKTKKKNRKQLWRASGNGQFRVRTRAAAAAAHTRRSLIIYFIRFETFRHRFGVSARVGGKGKKKIDEKEKKNEREQNARVLSTLPRGEQQRFSRCSRAGWKKRVRNTRKLYPSEVLAEPFALGHGPATPFPQLLRGPDLLNAILKPAIINNRLVCSDCRAVYCWPSVGPSRPVIEVFLRPSRKVRPPVPHRHGHETRPDPATRDTSALLRARWDHGPTLVIDTCPVDQITSINSSKVPNSTVWAPEPPG